MCSERIGISGKKEKGHVYIILFPNYYSKQQNLAFQFEIEKVMWTSIELGIFFSIHLVSPVKRKRARIAAGQRPSPRGIAAAAGRAPANIHRVSFPLSAGTLMGGKVGIVRIFRSGAANR